MNLFTSCTSARPLKSLHLAIGLFVCSVSLQSVPTQAQHSAPSVRLTIDFGDGAQKTFAALPFKEKMTVFDALQAAEKQPDGIKLKYMGRRETIFITAIDDAVNEGASGRNWRYTVNDQPAQSSAGVMELKAGDTVVWRFRK